MSEQKGKRGRGAAGRWETGGLTGEYQGGRERKEGEGPDRGRRDCNSFHFISFHFGQIEQKLSTKEGGNRA